MKKHSTSSGTLASLRETRALMMIASLLVGADYWEMSEEQLRAWIDERLRGYSEEFPDLLETLRHVLMQADPVQLLAMLDLRMAQPRGKDAEVDELFPLIQPHVELLQAVILQEPTEAYAWGNPNTAAFLDDIESILKRLSFLFTVKQWAPETNSRASAMAEVIQRPYPAEREFVQHQVL